MKKEFFTVSPFWDKKGMDKSSGKSRIMITVNMPRSVQFRVTVKLRATKEEFVKALSGRGGGEAIKELRKGIYEYKQKAERILERLPSPSKDAFLKLFKSETDLCLYNKTEIWFLMEQKREEMMKEERFGSARNLKLTISSLRKYRKDIYFEEVDEKFLKGYVAFMLAKGSSVTTANIYLRYLRLIFNKAIKEGYISPKHYPFKSYKISSSVRSKAVLYPEQLKAFWYYQPQNEQEAKAKAFFFFCYLSNGMNFKDVAYLKYQNIQSDTLVFVRQKTKTTTCSFSKEIKVYLHPEVRSIIERWGNKSKAPGDYIFPFLSHCTDALHRQKVKDQQGRLMNKYLVEIGVKLGFEVHLCLNLARHSFATRLKIEGVPVAFISEAMGHSSMLVTEHYLKSLPNENLKAMSNTLLDF